MSWGGFGSGWGSASVSHDGRRASRPGPGIRWPPDTIAHFRVGNWSVYGRAHGTKLTERRWTGRPSGATTFPFRKGIENGPHSQAVPGFPGHLPLHRCARLPPLRVRRCQEDHVLLAGGGSDDCRGSAGCGPGGQCSAGGEGRHSSAVGRWAVADFCRPPAVSDSGRIIEFPSAGSRRFHCHRRTGSTCASRPRNPEEHCESGRPGGPVD